MGRIKAVLSYRDILVFHIAYSFRVPREEQVYKDWYSHRGLYRAMTLYKQPYEP